MRRLGLVPKAPACGQEPVVRVALATQDGRVMNAHFGSAKRLSVFDVSAAHRQFVETISFEAVSDQSGTHTRDGDDKNAAKIRALAGVDVLIVQAIGGPVAARVIRAQIHPLKFAEPEPIDALVEKFQAILAGDERPLWLRKLLQQRSERSMDFLDEDEDDF